MIYWYTGQPGHGKTLHAIERALEFKANGRRVYVCNIRDFDYEKAGMERMTPEDFRNWMEYLPDGSVALVDEAYEHDMLPKRAPGAKVPAHVEQLAKHRHRGLDFIFVCQSPDKQCDVFTHDLIERHIHVRRRFGTSFVHLREFDRYEKNPEKGNPLVVRRKRLPKAVFGLYKSTELDTTERRIPWYYIAFAIGVPLGLGFMYYTFGNMGKRLGNTEPQTTEQITHGKPTEPQGDGGAARRVITVEDYIAKFKPRIPSQPWSASAYDGLSIPKEPPRVFCMIGGDPVSGSCSCLTEQGTKYVMDISTCRVVAVSGQYEPYLNSQDSRHQRGEEIQRDQRRAIDRDQHSKEYSGGALTAELQAGYGAMRSGASQPAITLSQTF